MRTLVIFAMALLASAIASAQTCPDRSGSLEASKDSVLRGTLLVHDDLRQWIGIKLEPPVCSHTEVQLIFTQDKAYRVAETMRECSVTATGKLFDSPTGYYSADMAVADAVLKPDSSCHPFPLERDPQLVPIRQGLQIYHASITVDYRGRGHVNVKVWAGNGKPAFLTPWQRYVSYSLTGGEDIIWLDCQTAFRVSDIAQLPENPNGTLKDGNLSGAALSDLNGVNSGSFTCKKKPHSAQQKASPSTPPDPK
jgi:hypothetical protein